MDAGSSPAVPTMAETQSRWRPPLLRNHKPNHRGEYRRSYPQNFHTLWERSSRPRFLKTQRGEHRCLQPDFPSEPLARLPVFEVAEQTGRNVGVMELLCN